MTAHEMFSDVPRGQVVATYDTYAEAQRAVDFLSDEKFPVQHVSIVGSDLRMVESVTGRLTRGRAALVGAGSGAWFGLLVGVLLSLFAESGTNAFVLVLAGVLYGVGFGAVFGFVGHLLSGGTGLHLAQQDREQPVRDRLPLGRRRQRPRGPLPPPTLTRLTPPLFDHVWHA